MMTYITIYHGESLMKYKKRLLGLIEPDHSKNCKLCLVWIANYKSLIIFFNIVPLITLKLMT